MRIFETEHSGSEVLYLTRREVIECFYGLDPVALTARTLTAHAAGTTRLPAEAYLGWETPSGHAARCLAMPGGIDLPDRKILGLKVINASLRNADRGMPRSQGFTMVFDEETARPLAVMEAAYISAIRTAAVTMLTGRELCRSGAATIALLGCGTLAQAHLEILPAQLPEFTEVRLFDLDHGRAQALADELSREPEYAGRKIVLPADAQSTVTGADLVVPVTTVTEGYLPMAWLSPGAVIAHVSLDDVLPDVVHGADLVLVDDWHLVRDDDRRLLGRMYRAGTLLAPDGSSWPGVEGSPQARKVDGTLGQLLSGVVAGRATDDDIILSNPFGMSILDIAVAWEVYRIAESAGLGRRLEI
jgi:N-[(2S)-2-amino-2-carboxyethyl]-L-glutamate dehydrogenase